MTSNDSISNVSTVFLLYDEKVLLLKRSSKVKTMKNKWAGISGFIVNESPLSCAYREIYEETGIVKEYVYPLRKGGLVSLFLFDNRIKLNIHPFLFLSFTKDIKLNWENSDYIWIKPQEITKFDTVPKLREILFSIME